MKTKRFDCVDMKHKGAERVYQAISGLSKEQQLDYWKRGSEDLRRALQKVRENSAASKSAK